MKREDIPEEELKAAGAGDPAKAPAELVAVLGDSRLKHWSAIYSIAYSPDGRTLASACGAGTIRLWDMETYRERAVTNSGGTLRCCVAFSHDGLLLASGSGNDVKIWDPADGRAVATLKGRTNNVEAIAFSLPGAWTIG